MNDLSHVDEHGKARMVDVGHKPRQRRRAAATGRIDMAAATAAQIRENEIAKGDVLTVAQVAGIQAAKRTAELIPLCHSLPLDCVSVELEVGEACVTVRAEAQCVGRTGVEMEALTAVSVALLTVYDMCKAVDKAMRIEAVELLAKTKSDVE